MDPNDPFTFLLQAIISGVVETVAGKAIDGGPRWAQRGKALLGLVERQPLTATEQAVAAAVAAARQEIIDSYRERDLALDDATSRDLVALLNHPPFAEEVARRLLFRGQPDLERLRQYYLDRGGAATSARWQALEEPLLDFFAAVEGHLLADPNLGPLLRATAQLAALTRLEQDTQLVAEFSRQALLVQTQIAASSQQSAVDVRSLLRVANRQEAQHGKMVELLAAVVELLAAHPQALPPASAPGAHPAPAEQPYLRLLREKCNRLPLALTLGKRGGARGKDEQPTLNNVYVDLQVEAQPTLEQVLTRLAVPPAEWPALRRKLGADPRTGRGAPRGAGELGIGEPAAELAEQWQRFDVNRMQVDEAEWQKHPLRPWAKEPDALRAALQPLLALEALRARPQMVLLGDPGSGKTTLVNHLAYVLAGGRLGELPEWQETLHHAFAQPLLPLRVLLRRWSASLHAHGPQGLELAYSALDALQTGLSRADLIAVIERGEALVLFDGLDETPIVAAGGHEIDRRRHIVEAVSAFCTAHPRCPVLVTSRKKPYEQANSPYRIADLTSFVLAPLDDELVARFIERWYDELARRDPLRRDEAMRNRSRLLAAVRTNGDLRELAGTPILLTMLARINAGQPLPESRAALYHECVEQLLYDWDEIKAEDIHEALADAGADATAPASTAPAPTLERLLAEPGVAKKRPDFERVLWQVTYDAHKASGRRQADLSADVLEAKLAHLHADRHKGKEWASRVVEFISLRSGLLVESEPGVFTFPHTSFQEYLTARWLLEQESCPQDAAELAALDHWREVILLACGYLATKENAFNRVVSIVDELAACDVMEPKNWPRLLVAGQAWKEFDGRSRQVSARGDELRTRIPALLTRLMQLRDAPAAQRLAAGLLAADVADPPPDLAGDPVLIPITGFADKSRRYEFQIGQYPVTNAQFRRFVDAGGYDRARPWWTPQALQEIEQYWNGWPTAPRYWDDTRFNHSTQPVVGVSWYEAMAYCAWLTEEWAAQGRLDGTRYAVRLPTEAEWIWAAAGAARRTYAWGDEFAAWRANTKESNLNLTTPVHMYPDGTTPASAADQRIWDLCGNVWEWCFDDAEYGKRLMGGAYYTDKARVGPAARIRHDPGFWNHNWGMRVVVVPILSP